MSDKIKVKYDGRYLQAYMPNGEVIPQQTEIKIENKVGDKNMALVTVQVWADISNLKAEPDIDYKETTQVLEGENTELKDQLYSAIKSAKFWEREHLKESNKKWYHKLLNR